MTAEQLARRDRIVFEGCREIGVPVVVNLAGGYQKPVEKVVQLHVNTLRALSGVWDAQGDTQGSVAAIPA